MPLVVPGLMSKDGGKSGGDDWMSKLMGKKLGEQHDEIVSRPHIPPHSIFPPSSRTLHLSLPASQ
jgi:hypothetical protein